jgi:hypothetical protein
MKPEQILADVAARIRQADEQAELAAAAYSAGPAAFGKYLEAQQDKILTQIEEMASAATDAAGGDC